MTILRKVPQDQLNVFYHDYYCGLYPDLRLGQAFLARFYPGVNNPDLLYSNDELHTQEYIMEHYLVIEKVA